ncbi:hypothetical protein AVEN_200808-1 [Araneus ventricosus]|uniref:Uncharacterized protein n=1 Tax=Araneus ventricosus TaxID=182803 RepID=A0A4Y2CGN2_ARAVE|nr:hypothetical protein AVEN_200808-1 [Araneus ventricosus]
MRRLQCSEANESCIESHFQRTKVPMLLPAKLLFSSAHHVGVCPTGGTVSPTPAVWGDECSEIGLKYLPDYYLSATVEYPVQTFSPTVGWHNIPDSPLWRHPWTYSGLY